MDDIPQRAPSMTTIPPHLDIAPGDPIAAAINPEMIKMAILSVRHLFPPEIQAKVDEVGNMPSEQLMGTLQQMCSSIDTNALMHTVNSALPADLPAEQRNLLVHQTLGAFNFFRMQPPPQQ
jgi:hypothetical protein